MFKHITFFITFILLCSVGATAQNTNGTIKGFVYDKKTGEPMIYTNVLFKGISQGAQTDGNGYFSIQLAPGSYTMYVTNVGYDTATVDINLLAGAILTKKVLIVSNEHELKGVEVSSKKTDKVTRINIGKTTIAPREIKLLPSAGGEPDVAQFLQVIPGVVFTGDQGGQLYIRGGSPSQTGIYLDGVTIYNPFHTIGLFSVFETEAIRNVDVYTAGFNAQYENRTSAIVDLHTKDGNKNEIAGLLSVSPIMTRALLEGPLVKSKKDNGSGITFLVTAKTSYLDQTSKSIYGGLGEPFSNGLPYRFTDVYGKVTFNGDNGSKLNLFGFNFDDHASILNDTSFIPTADYHWTASGGGATFIVSPSGSAALIDGRFAYSKYNISLNEASSTIPRTSQIDGFEGAMNFSYFLPNYSELKYGFDVSGSHTNLSYLSSYGVGTSLDRQSTMAGAFLLFRKNISSRFIFEPSIRFQYYSELSKLSPEPRIGLKLNLTDNIRLKAAAGIYSENIISTKSDKDIVNFFSGFLLSPDQQLQTVNGNDVASNLQTAYHVLGGIEVDMLNNKLELNAEPWMKVFGQIDEYNRDKQFVSQPDFIAASGKAYGLDVSGKYNNKRWYLLVAIGYQEINYTSLGPDGLPQTFPPPFDTRVNGNVVASYSAGKKKDLDISMRFNFHSPFPFTQTQGFYENPKAQTTIGENSLGSNGNVGLIYANEINGGRLSYYHRLDFSVRKRFQLTKKSSLDGTFSITNVYDRNNIFYVDRYTSVRLYQLPFFPSVNLTWNF